MEKIIKRKARKQYQCDCGDCEKTINKGDLYWYMQYFCPPDDEFDKCQFGFLRFHIDCYETEDQRLERQKHCFHVNIDMHWTYIPGEAVKEPAYDYCIDCGKVMI